MDKKLKLSRTNKIVAGVCGGIAEYFSVDPTLVRVIWVLATIFLNVGFPMAIILYIIFWAIMPLQD